MKQRGERARVAQTQFQAWAFSRLGSSDAGQEWAVHMELWPACRSQTRTRCVPEEHACPSRAASCPHLWPHTLAEADRSTLLKTHVKTRCDVTKCTHFYYDGKTQSQVDHQAASSVKTVPRQQTQNQRHGVTSGSPGAERRPRWASGGHRPGLQGAGRPAPCSPLRACQREGSFPEAEAVRGAPWGAFESTEDGRPPPPHAFSGNPHLPSPAAASASSQGAGGTPTAYLLSAPGRLKGSRLPRLRAPHTLELRAAGAP